MINTHFNTFNILNSSINMYENVCEYDPLHSFFAVMYCLFELHVLHPTIMMLQSIQGHTCYGALIMTSIEHTAKKLLTCLGIKP